MSFSRFVCWDPERLDPVLDTEALQPSRAAFLATHHPIMMYRQEGKDENTRQPYSEQEFLRDFLEPKDFAFVPVLGNSGTGKSHLIRWLEASIESGPSRRVLLIPKVGTNLRNIIERMLDVVEGPRASSYRARLVEATDSLTEADAGDHLLNSLAALIQRSSETPPQNLDDLQSFLFESLPAFLYDWQVRGRLLAEDGIIRRLVAHIIGSANAVEDVEERRRITERDLPSNILDIDQAGLVAREVYSFLDMAEARAFVVDTLNRHLDEAISSVLKLDRDDLPSLMREVREALAEQGIELILLIEDFAKLQGIDRQVLEAVLVRPNQPGQAPLCALRTAFACTTGYFDSLIDTIAQRATFSVTLDVGIVGDGGLVGQADLEAFVARYLNAVRISETDLEEWYDGFSGSDGGQRESPPSRCDSCEFQSPCHGAFGNRNGMGLYPFTSGALERMLARAETKGQFVPRLIIKRILDKTLRPYWRDLKTGKFPPPALVLSFGGGRVGARLASDIEASDPVDHSRREVLLDLWAGATELVDLDPRIHQAFDIPPLGVQVVSDEARPTTRRDPVSVAPEPAGASSSRAVEAKIEALNKWRNGVQLPQDVAQYLRELVYPAVVERIDWEGEMLYRGAVISREAGIFVQAHVNFENATTRSATPRGVELLIPPDRDFHGATLALQALIQHKAHGGWNYEGGARDFRDYARQLELWSHSVVARIRSRATKSDATWDPVPAATELLVLGARLAGRPQTADCQLVDLVEEMFRQLESADAPSRGDVWKKLFEKFRTHQLALQDIVRSSVACAKGRGPQKPQVIDAVQLLEPLLTLRKHWRPTCDVPDDLRSDFNAIRTLRRHFDESLDAAIEEERSRVDSWHRFVVEQLGGKDVVEVARALREAASKAREIGQFAGTNKENYEVLIAKFESSDAVELLAELEPIKSESDPANLFDRLACVPTAKIDEISDFITQSISFLDQSSRRVQSDLENLRQGGGAEVEDSQAGIKKSLGELSTLLARA